MSNTRAARQVVTCVAFNVLLGVLATPELRADPWGESYTLANGLRVVLSPDPRAPTVTVFVRYHVGARQEPAGRSGMAHLLEHLTFELQKPAPRAWSYPARWSTTSSNGSTSFEHTDYFTRAAPGNLKYALWSERWRMGPNLDNLTESERTRELGIVQNERRERLDLAPYAGCRHRLWGELFPAGHPFHDVVIGSPEDLAAITLDEAKAFFTRFYGPGNATLAVVGSFVPGEARQIIDEYYAPMPAVAPLPPLPPLPPAAREPRGHEVVIRHEELHGRAPRLIMAWLTPAKYTREHAAGEVAAQILGGLRGSRIRVAVPDMAVVGVEQVSLLETSVFELEVEPPEGMSLDALAAQIDGLLEVMRAQPPAAAEVEAAVRRLRWERWYQADDQVGKAALLVDALVDGHAPADPLRFAQERYAQVTPQDVQAFAREYLGSERRVVVRATPRGARP